MRLADIVLRRGHLSDQALADVCMTGDRPVHLERCDVCAERAVDMGRWLDQVRLAGIESADAAFPPERLAAQQAQVLRKIEHLEQPARVIAFPGQAHLHREGSRRIRPAWVGVAAAAGLLLGLVGGQMSARLAQPRTAPPAIVAVPAATPAVQAPARKTPAQAAADDRSWLELDRPHISAIDAIDELTPRQTDVVLASLTRVSRDR